MTLFLFMIMSLTMKAQIFMMDGKEDHREPENPQVFAGLPEDFAKDGEYSPVGDGILLFAALGGAYLLGKKRKKD